MAYLVDLKSLNYLLILLNMQNLNVLLIQTLLVSFPSEMQASTKYMACIFIGLIRFFCFVII